MSFYIQHCSCKMMQQMVTSRSVQIPQFYSTPHNEYPQPISFSARTLVVAIMKLLRERPDVHMNSLPPAERRHTSGELVPPFPEKKDFGLLGLQSPQKSDFGLLSPQSPEKSDFGLLAPQSPEKSDFGLLASQSLKSDFGLLAPQSPEKSDFGLLALQSPGPENESSRHILYSARPEHRFCMINHFSRA